MTTLSSSLNNGRPQPDFSCQQNTPFTCFKDGRYQINFSRLIYFNKISQSPSDVVVRTSSLVDSILKTIHENKIHPGLWLQSEMKLALNQSSKISETLRIAIWNIVNMNLALPKIIGCENAEEVNELNNLSILKTECQLSLPVGDEKAFGKNYHTLFSRVFFGDFWLKHPLLRDGSILGERTYNSQLCNNQKTSDLIAKALNSQTCIESSKLSDNMLMQVMLEEGYLGDLLPDHVPMQLFEMANTLFNSKSSKKISHINILNLCPGWAGCLISAVAWAKRNTNIKVNLISCNDQPQLNQSIGILQDFLQKEFQTPNLQMTNVDGKFFAFNSLEKISKICGDENMIIIGSLATSDVGEQVKILDKDHLATTLAKCALLLNRSANNALAFWTIPKNENQSRENLLIKTPEICKAFGLKLMSNIYFESDHKASKSPLKCNELLMIAGGQSRLTSDQLEAQFQEKIVKEEDVMSSLQTSPGNNQTPVPAGVFDEVDRDLAKSLMMLSGEQSNIPKKSRSTRKRKYIDSAESKLRSNDKASNDSASKSNQIVESKSVEQLNAKSDIGNASRSNQKEDISVKSEKDNMVDPEKLEDLITRRHPALDYEPESINEQRKNASMKEIYKQLGTILGSSEMAGRSNQDQDKSEKKLNPSRPNKKKAEKKQPLSTKEQVEKDNVELLIQAFPDDWENTLNLVHNQAQSLKLIYDQQQDNRLPRKESYEQFIRNYRRNSFVWELHPDRVKEISLTKDSKGELTILGKKFL